MAKVAGLNVFPIKSCRGLALDAADVQTRGLAGDRRFMLVDANGRFLTQRQHPKMARLRITIGGGHLSVDDGEREPLVIPEAPAFGDVERVRIWRGLVDASIAGGEINGWFSEFMGRGCRLAYMRDEQHRAVPHASASFDDEVSFADGAPLLLIAEASLAELNERLARPVTMARFRPNIVVAGTDAFAEDEWRRIRIGDVELQIAWPCSRCLMTTVDPETAERDVEGEPFETLRSYRSVNGRVMFGQNAIPRRLGRIAVGDSVEVLNE